jgi:prephenate dehydratase
MKKILIQGIEGSNHDLAVREYFGEDSAAIIPCLSFRELFSQLRADPQLLGMVAMENTLAGSLLPNYNLLQKSGLKIIGEHKMRISHHLMALPGQRLEQIHEVHSHPMALAQCEDFLANHPNIRQVADDDTAQSAKEIAGRKLSGRAAVAGSLAASLFGLEILASGIESNAHNLTRFLLIGHEQPDEMAVRANKSSLVFTLPHQSGSLSQVLSVIAFYGINLTKIQSMPIVGREWQYLFYTDFTFDDFARYRQALDAIRPLCQNLDVLGEYATHESRVHQQKTIAS